MKLILGSGFPFPFPEGLSDVEKEGFSMDAPGVTMTIEDVKALEWKFTLTVEFKNHETMMIAQNLTGWNRWSDEDYVLEAKLSGPDGYETPAVVVGDTAYCGILLTED